MKIQQLKENTEIDLHNLNKEKLLPFSDGIEILIQDKKNYSIFKGMTGMFTDTNIGIFDQIKNRKPANADTTLYHYLFSIYEPWKSLPPRNVVTTTDKNNAHGYGKLYYIIPKNGTTLCILPEIDLWDSFDSKILKYGFLDKEMGSLEDLTKFNESILKFQEILTTLSGIKYDKNGNNLERMIELSDESKESQDYEEKIDYLIDVEAIDPSKKKIWMTTKISKILKDFLNIKIKTISTNEISKITQGMENEIWFDSPFLAISEEYIDKLIEEYKK